MSEDISKEPLPPSRRKRSREEPEEDLDYEDEIAFPPMVKAAGVIWIVFGCIILLNLVALVFIVFLFAANQRNGPAAAGAVGGGLCVAVIGGLFAAAFLYVGAQTARGTARDTVGNSVGSFVFALFNFGGAAVNAAGGGFVQAVVSALGGTLLLAAGVLALAGRSQYKLWRKEQARRLKQEAAERKAARRFRK
jgi:hypothetical protein